MYDLNVNKYEPLCEQSGESMDDLFCFVYGASHKVHLST